MAFFDTIRQKWRGSSEPSAGIFDENETDRGDELEIPNNPSGREFLDSARAAIRKTLERYSVTQNALTVGARGRDGAAVNAMASAPFGASGVFNPASDVDVSFESSTLGLAVPVETNKMARLQSYDNIARYPELDWCINEIANDFIHEDIEGDFIKLKFKCDQGKYGDGADKVIEEEFRHLVSGFDLRSNGYNMMRKFLIEGEICFENVIDPNHPEYGVIGEKYVPNVFYDFLRDKTTGQVCGLYIDPEKMKTYMQFGAYGGGANSYGGQSSTMYNAVRQIPAFSYTYSQDMKNKIVMPWEQVTYANSGVLSEDGSIVFPHIEKVVVPIRQLLLMHDAMVIMRITRAPEKLLFNIDMTGLQPREAKNYVRKFVEQRRSKKALQGSGTLTNVYNSETMLDAYYFWKTSDSAGTRVESLNSNTVRFNELHDVEYFLRRVLKFLNIPWSRWAESQANRQDKNSIQNEEFSFAKMIVRFQQTFSAAVKKTFITHLRLRELFDKYGMSESDFDVVMNPPSMFENYQAEIRFSDFLDVMSKMPGVEFLSKNIVLKKIFGWNDSDIKENEVNVRREALYKAQSDFMVQMVAAQGTPTAGRIWLDPEKYLNPPPSNPTGTDANGGAPMPPPQGGAPMPDGGMPPPDGGMGQPPPPPQGEMPMGGEAQPQLPMTPPTEGGDNGNLEIPEPSVPVDDSETTTAEKTLPVNPEFGDFEKTGRRSNVDLENGYPETEEELEDLRTGRNQPMKDIFDRNLGTERDVDMRMDRIFIDEFGVIHDKGAEKRLSDVFSNELGTSDSGKSGGKSMSDAFSEEFGNAEDGDERSRESSLTDIFDTEFGKPSRKAKTGSLELSDTFKDIFIRKRR